MTSITFKLYYSTMESLMDIVIFHKKLEKTGELECDLDHAEDDDKRFVERIQ